MSIQQHTPGPWPWGFTGDGKRIVIGGGLVEGPNGYEVAEVYSDDCPQEVAEANARLIAEAPAMLAALRDVAAGRWGWLVDGDGSDTIKAILARIDGRAE